MLDERRSKMAQDAVEGRRRLPAETVPGDRNLSTSYGESTSKPDPLKIRTMPKPGSSL